MKVIEFLKKRGKYSNTITPNLILLDLNLPKRNSFYVLKEIKENEILRRIPVVILTLSDARDDIIKAYNLHANCYLVKPIEMNEFYRIINSIMNFWFITVKQIEVEQSKTN